MKIEKGQHWGTIEIQFLIERVEQVNGESWIYYSNLKTGQQYSCLEPAFRQRFCQTVK